MKKKYNYAHILWHDELKFNTILVEFLNRYFCEENKNEHVFYTPYLNVYENLKHHNNVFYFEQNNPKSSKIVNFVGKQANWIFLHNICESIELLKIHPRYIKKIIWRTWGGSRLEKIESGNNIVKNFAFKAIDYEVKRRVRNFKLIGVANAVDVVALSDRFGDCNFIKMPYSQSNNEMYDGLLKLKNSTTTKETYNIIVGHSGFYEDDHINVLNRLLKYKNENIKVYLLLSYGNEEYMQKVKEYAVNNWREKVEIITDFLPFDEFARLLSIMDAAVYSGLISYALGNIGIMLYFGKKIFLNEEGIIARTFKKYNVPYSSVSDIGCVDFDELTRQLKYDDSNYKEFCYFSVTDNIDQWNCILDRLS